MRRRRREYLHRLVLAKQDCYNRVVQALRIDGHEVYGIFTELVDLQLALKAHEHLFADPITTEEATTKIG